MTLTSKLPLRTIVSWLLPSVVAMLLLISPARAEPSDLILQRADGDRMRDSIGYLYRRCTGMMS